MSTDDNKNNVIADNNTVENNINPVNEIIIDNNLLKFMFHSIEKLEVRPNNVIEFEVFFKSIFQSYSYLLNYNHFENSENYVKEIQMLFVTILYFLYKIKWRKYFHYIHKMLLHKML